MCETCDVRASCAWEISQHITREHWIEVFQLCGECNGQIMYPDHFIQHLRLPPIQIDQQQCDCSLYAVPLTNAAGLHVDTFILL